ncbi:MAG: DUF3488 domain-containing protein [Nitrospirae bacterium]|nr:MAG: DUF3488 domain-containing protein [Nitrospirota bacterium]
MPTGYKALTFFVALVGNLSLVVTGQINPLFLFPGAAFIIGYIRALKGKAQANRYLIGTGSTIVLMVFLLDAFLLSGDIIVGVAHLSLLFHSLKSFDIKDPWDPLQVFFMSLIQLLLASELTRSMMFGVFFLLFILFMVFALFYSHLIKEGHRDLRPFIKPISVLSLIVLTLTVVFFILTPRLQGSLWSRGLSKGLRSGFSENIKLGGLGTLKLDPTVVMRVSVSSKPSDTPYWRGITYDLYQSNQWISLSGEKRELFKREGSFTIKEIKPSRTFTQEVILEPLDTDVVFYTGQPLKLKADIDSLYVDEKGTLYVPEKKNRRFHYVVISTDTQAPFTYWSPLYLHVPEELVRLKALAKAIVKDAKRDTEKIGAIMNYLRKNYTYSLSVNHQGDTNPVEDFLFNTKRGYCEHYATAMALMLRAVGVPSRVVSGYMGGEFNSYGNYYIIRQRDAHTWVEALVNDRWVRFDPTPGVSLKRPSTLLLYLDYLKLKWERYVVQFSRYDQIKLFRLISTPLDLGWLRYKTARWVVYVLMVLSVALFLAFLFRYRSSSGMVSAPGRLFLKLKGLLGLRGNLTPMEVLTKVKGRNDPRLFELTSEFLSLYQRLRFSKRPDLVEQKTLHALYQEIKHRLKTERGSSSSTGKGTKR